MIKLQKPIWKFWCKCEFFDLLNYFIENHILRESRQGSYSFWNMEIQKVGLRGWKVRVDGDWRRGN